MFFIQKIYCKYRKNIIDYKLSKEYRYGVQENVIVQMVQNTPCTQKLPSFSKKSIFQVKYIGKISS